MSMYGDETPKQRLYEFIDWAYEDSEYYKEHSFQFCIDLLGIARDLTANMIVNKKIEDVDTLY